MMQWLRTYLRTFAARLLAIMASLIVLTTLGAGAPAYLGARSALEERSWAQVADAGETTLALLWAEQARLTTLVRLLAERPTLRRLLEEGSAEELQRYLDDFRSQSALDQLLLCMPEQTIRTGAHTSDNCHGHDQARMVTSGGQLRFTAGGAVAESASRISIGVTVDAAWLNKLSGQQSTFAGIYRSDGSRLFSALPDDLPVLALPGPTGAVQEKVDYGGQPLYLWLKPFPAELTEQPLWLTVALPVAFLDANNQRALTILLISTVLITVAGLSLATWFVRRLTRPLEMLRSMAEMVAQGNLETTVPVVAGPIEVESLATALRGSQQRMRTALDEAAHTNRRLDSLVQSIAEGMLTLNSGGTITFANAGAEALIGRPLADLVGSHIDDNLWLRNGEPISKRLPAAPGRLQLTVRTAAAAQSLQVTATQLPPVPFEPAQRVLVLRDMTEEESLRRLQSQFLAGISHEFQTPLATLRAAMELLLANDDTRDSDDFERRELTMEDVRQLLGPMHLSLTGLQTLVNNLLESGRIEAGQFVVTMQPLRFEPVVTAALEIIQPQLNRKGQALVLSEPAEALVVTGDRSRLVQVLVNLLSNASKYSPSGTPIELELLRTAHWLTARIHDRGPGVAPADRAHLFRSFVRLEHHAANAPGTGLGLYVAKQIIDAHGGEVGVDNRAGGGATFWFTLPLQMGGEAQGQGLPVGAADFYEDLDL